MSASSSPASPGAFRKALGWLDDTALGLGVVLLLPVAILAIGVPIAVVVRLVLAAVHRL